MVTTVSRSLFAALFTAGLSCGNGTEREHGTEQDWANRRKQMVDEQLKARDIRNERVLGAMLEVPRHLFVPESEREQAYDDGPLPIGYDQTISQPYIVAFMTQALDLAPDHRVLEIGTGSGYQAAVLGRLVRDVYTIEILEPLAERARGDIESARLPEHPRPHGKRVFRLARARAVRPHHGHRRTRRSAAGAGGAIENGRIDGHSGGNGGAAAARAAPDDQGNGIARHASSALRPHGRQAAGRIQTVTITDVATETQKRDAARIQFDLLL